jgi:hypothetical protein
MPLQRTGVSVAAKSASEALELLADVGGSPEARTIANRLTQLASADVENVREFLRSHSDASTAKMFEGPIETARGAVQGLELCVDAATTVKASVSADVAAAATIITGAVRAILQCLDANHPLPETVEKSAQIQNRALQLESAVKEQLALRRSD